MKFNQHPMGHFKVSILVKNEFFLIGPELCNAKNPAKTRLLSYYLIFK